MADKLSSEKNDVMQTPPEQEQPPHETEKRLGMTMLMKVALAAVVISSLIISVAGVMQVNYLLQQEEELQVEIDKYNEKNRELLYWLEREIDDSYIVDYARKVLSMFFPDEEIFHNN